MTYALVVLCATMAAAIVPLPSRMVLPLAGRPIIRGGAAVSPSATALALSTSTFASLRTVPAPSNSSSPTTDSSIGEGDLVLEPLLEAIEAMCPIVECLGPVFGVARQELINKVADLRRAAGDGSAVADALRSESGARAALWLSREMAFLVILAEHLCAVPTVSVPDAVR